MRHSADRHELVLCQHRTGPGDRRVGLRDRFLDELGAVGHAGQVDALGGKLDRPQLHVCFQEKVLGIQGHLEHHGQGVGIGSRSNTNAESQRVGLDLQHLIDDRIIDLNCQPAILVAHNWQAATPLRIRL